MKRSLWHTALSMFLVIITIVALVTISKLGVMVNFFWHFLSWITIWTSIHYHAWAINDGGKQ